MNNPAMFAHGKHTLWGVYYAHRDQIAYDRGWNSETLKGYESSILNKIVPHIPGHNYRPLSTLTKADFEAALAAIKKEGYISENGIIHNYDEDTLGRFWYIMEVITETAEMNYLCRNVLAPQPANSHQNHRHVQPGKVVPRYMPPDIEQRAGDLLLTNAMQKGQFMGLAGMLCWGGRNAEAAGLNFGDVQLWQDIPECWVAWVYKTTMIDSNQLQSGGKTRNADRVVLLPNRYVQLVLERKQKLQELLGPGVDIDSLPIACRDNHYFTRCSADDLTAAAKQLFSQLRIPPEHIELAYEDLQLAISVENDPLALINVDYIEKDPTAYYLRRVYGTALACVGLTEEDIAFQIGHDLGGAPEYRNELLNTGKLLEIKAKLDMRPVVNSLDCTTHTDRLSLGSAVSISHHSTAQYHFPSGTHRVELHLSTREPLDEVQITIQNKGSHPARIISTSYTVVPYDYPTELDVTTDYHQLYKTKRSD